VLVLKSLLSYASNLSSAFRNPAPINGPISSRSTSISRSAGIMRDLPVSVYTCEMPTGANNRTSRCSIREALQLQCGSIQKFRSLADAASSSRALGMSSLLDPCIFELGNVISSNKYSASQCASWGKYTKPFSIVAVWARNRISLSPLGMQRWIWCAPSSISSWISCTPERGPRRG